MPKPLSEMEITAREREQRADIYFRENFLQSNIETQRKIVQLLGKMSKLIGNDLIFDAQQYFFRQLSKHKKTRYGDYVDKNGVDWSEVRIQIIHFCFSDHDMEGYTIVPRRVEQSLTVFRALMDPDVQIDEF